MRCPTARRRRSSSAAPIPTTPASSTTFSSPTRISIRSSDRHFRLASAARSPWPNTASCNGRRALFRTTLANDILPLQSPANGFGYYANVGTTLRQGAELSAQWRNDRWSVYANYTYIDAVYLTTFLEPSPFNPAANANGLIPITNGTPIAGIPTQDAEGRLRLRRDRQMEGRRRHGRGLGPDDFRQRERRLAAGPGLRRVRRSTRPIRSASNCRSMGLSRTFSDQHYYTYGGLFDAAALPHAAPYLTDPRSLGPAAPFAVYAGLRYTM